MNQGLHSFFPPNYLEEVHGMYPQHYNGAAPFQHSEPPGQHQSHFYADQFQPNVYQEKYQPQGYAKGFSQTEQPLYEAFVTNPYPQTISPSVDQPYAYQQPAYQAGNLPRARFDGGNEAGGHFQGGRPVYAMNWEALHDPARTIRREAYQEPDGNNRQKQAAEQFKRGVQNSMIGMKVKVGKKDYTVVEVLHTPVTGISSQNDGIRVLKNAKGILIVQKMLKMGTSERRQRAETEKHALNQIAKAGGSSNINKIYEAFWAAGSTQSTLMLEYCNRGNLEDFIETYKRNNRKIPEMFCWKVLFGLSAALCMCHLGIRDPANPELKFKDWNTICHLDIKGANVFLDFQGPNYMENLPFVWPAIVLGDFGCAVTRDDIVTQRVDHRLQPYGTPFWFPPENEDELDAYGMGKVGSYGKFTDIWQMGGVVQTMCRLLNAPDMFWVDQKRPAGNDYTADMNEALKKCMVRDFKLRPTALDVAVAVMGLMKQRDEGMELA